jgi:hypothetical protein
VANGVVHYADYTAHIKSPIRAAWHMDLDRFTVLYQFDAKATKNRTARLAATPAVPAADPANVVDAQGLTTDPRTIPYLPIADKVVKQYKIISTTGYPVRAVVEGDGVDLFYQLDRMSSKSATLQLDFKQGAQQPQEVIFTLQCAKPEPFVAPTPKCTIPQLLTALASLQHCATKPKSAKYTKDQIAKETAKAQVVDLLVGLLNSNPGRWGELPQKPKDLVAWLSETPESIKQFKDLIGFLKTVGAQRWADILKRVQIRQAVGTPVLPAIEASILQVIRHEWKGDVSLAGQYGVVQNNADGTVLVQLFGAPYPTFFAMTPQGKIAEMNVSLCEGDFATKNPQVMPRLITAEISLFAARKGTAAPGKSPAAPTDLKALMPQFADMKPEQLRALLDKGVVVQQDANKNMLIQVNRGKDPAPVFTLQAPTRNDTLADQQAAQAELQLEIAQAVEQAGTPYYFMVRPTQQGELRVTVLTPDNPTPIHSFKL